jgi:hypothetical protein
MRCHHLDKAASVISATKFVPIQTSRKKRGEISRLRPITAIAAPPWRAPLCPARLHHAKTLCSAAANRGDL